MPRSTHESRRRAWLTRLAKGQSAGPFRADWSSLAQYRAAHWYEEARFGVLVRWGCISLVETLDPGAWATVFREAGARYVLALPEDDTGLAMYHSRLSDWTVGRDLLRELRAAMLSEGLHFGLAAQLAGHDESFTRATPESQDLWLARMAELVTRYEPDLVCFDRAGTGEPFHESVPKLLAYYYNRAASRRGVVIHYNKSASARDGMLDLAFRQSNEAHEQVWQAETSIVTGRSGGASGQPRVTSPTLIIQALADVVSRNGNLLVEVGPQAAGAIAPEAQQVLREIGTWLKVNGEAIYGAKPWTRTGEGPTVLTPGALAHSGARTGTPQDFRFTTRDGYLYAIQLGWSDGAEAVIRSILPKISVREVRLLATGKAIPFTQTHAGLHLMLPKNRCGEHAWVFRIEVGSLS